MRRYENAGLIIDPQRASPTQFRLDWTGRSDDRSPGVALRPYLQTVLEEARQVQASIELHFEALDYFNSSTVSVLLDFVVHARRDEVPLRFIYAGAVRWQRLSFDALRVFASLDKGIEVFSLDELAAGVSAPVSVAAR